MKKKGAVWVLLSLFLVLSGSGRIETTDADPSIQTAKAFLNGRLDVGKLPGVRDKAIHYRWNPRDGNWYTKMGVLPPLLYVLPVALAQSLHPVFPSLSEQRWTHLLCSFTNAFVVALLVTLFLTLLLPSHLGLWEWGAWAGVVTVSTLLWPYSKSSFREPLLALLTLRAWVSYQLILEKNNNRIEGAWLGLAMAGLVLTKLVAALIALPIFLAALGFSYKQKKQVAWEIFIPFFVGLLIWGGFSWAAYGQVGHTGYSHKVSHLSSYVWSMPLVEGLGMQLVSVDRGLLFYCPLSFVGLLWGFLSWGRKLGSPKWAVWALVVGMHLLVYAKWHTPVGGEATGPRYLVGILPLLLLPLFERLQIKNLFSPWRWGVASVGLLAALGAFIQLGLVSHSTQHYYQHVQWKSPLGARPQWIAGWGILSDHFHQHVRVPASRGKLTSLLRGEAQNRGWVAQSWLRPNFWWAHQKTRSERQNPAPSVGPVISHNRFD